MTAAEAAGEDQRLVRLHAFRISESCLLDTLRELRAHLTPIQVNALIRRTHAAMLDTAIPGRTE